MKELSKILLPIALLFIIVAGHTETAYGQNCLDNDSLIHYTDEMDKKCLECLVNKPKKDSLISNLSLQILNFKTIIGNHETITKDLEDQNEKQGEEIHSLSLSLSRQKRLVKIGVLGGVGVGLVGGLLLFR